MNNVTKNFFDLTGGGKIKSFSGRPKGEQLRQEWSLDSLEEDPNTHITIKVPEFIYNLGPSFLQGLFTQTIFKPNGLDLFRSKYTIEASSLILEQINYMVEKLDRENGKPAND